MKFNSLTLYFAFASLGAQEMTLNTAPISEPIVPNE